MRISLHPLVSICFVADPGTMFPHWVVAKIPPLDPKALPRGYSHLLRCEQAYSAARQLDTLRIAPLDGVAGLAQGHRRSSPHGPLRRLAAVPKQPWDCSVNVCAHATPPAAATGEGGMRPRAPHPARGQREGQGIKYRLLFDNTLWNKNLSTRISQTSTFTSIWLTPMEFSGSMMSVLLEPWRQD